MAWETHPVTPDRFEDFADVLNPSRRATHCWCLSLRLSAAEIEPAVEAHPVDPAGRMDTTMAFVGTRSMFDRAGFRVIGTTDATASGMPRLVMRRDLP